MTSAPRPRVRPPAPPVAEMPLRLVDGTSTTVPALADDGLLVLFFFPAAFSPGCVAEACAFRNLSAEFAQVGATCVGVSADTPRRLRAFARSFRLGMPLVSDRRGALAARFGAARRFPARFLRRVTVVVDGDGSVLHRVEGLRDLAGHADAVVAYLAASHPSDGLPEK